MKGQVLKAMLKSMAKLGVNLVETTTLYRPLTEVQLQHLEMLLNIERGQWALDYQGLEVSVLNLYPDGEVIVRGLGIWAVDRWVKYNEEP